MGISIEFCACSGCLTHACTQEHTCTPRRMHALISSIFGLFHFPLGGNQRKGQLRAPTFEGFSSFKTKDYSMNVCKTHLRSRGAKRRWKAALCFVGAWICKKSKKKKKLNLSVNTKPKIQDGGWGISWHDSFHLWIDDFNDMYAVKHHLVLKIYGYDVLLLLYRKDIFCTTNHEFARRQKSNNTLEKKQQHFFSALVQRIMGFHLKISPCCSLLFSIILWALNRG